MWGRLWASILAFLGLNLGRALGLNFSFFGPKFGQGSGLHFWQFWIKFAFKTPVKFDQKWENFQNLSKIGKIAYVGQKLPNLPKWQKMPKFAKNRQICLKFTKIVKKRQKMPKKI
jgi:hypothetical protein